MRIYFGENLFWVSMGLGFMKVGNIYEPLSFEKGGGGGRCVRFLNFGVPNMFPKLFLIVTIRTTHFIVRRG
jgi:hypothetical protein